MIDAPENHQSGRAWGKKAPDFDKALALSSAGSLGGELLRRYWQPVALSSQLLDLPLPIKVLGEDLVLFRDGNGVPGLLDSRCCHRGSSLVYGKIEKSGLRCCYHGWVFDARGNCLETPCEPASTTRARVRQPWYPVLERFGLVFAYMGPAELQPKFPHISLCEGLSQDEVLVAFERTCGPNSAHPKLAGTTDYNWWQAYDNFMDPFHVPIIHHMINGPQFVDNLGIIPNVRFEYASDGVISVQHRTLADGKVHQRVSQVIMPNIHCTAGITDEDLGRSNIGWLVPKDDTSYRHFVVMRVKRGGSHLDFLARIGMMDDGWGPDHGRPFMEWDLEDHQRWQTDYIAQKSQGTITLHSEEHLGVTDKGIGMMRRMFKKMAQSVATEDRSMARPQAQAPRIDILAGNALLDGKTGACIAGFDAMTQTESQGAQ